MPRFFKSLAESLKALFKHQIPVFYALAMRGVDVKNLGTSWTARLSRVWGGKV
jgi:hypothetical protein